MQAELEKNMQEMDNKLEEKFKIQIVQQENKMQETQAKIEDSMQEMYKKMEEILKSQLQQERRIEENRNKLEDDLKQQSLRQENTMLEMYNKLESNLTTQLLQMENLKKTENLAGINDIVIQRRMDGSVDFQRTWQEYREGFGNKSGEFFIGLDILHNLTSSRRYELWIDLEDWENDRRHAKYDNFIIGSKAEKYALKSLGEYSGTAGNSMLFYLGQPFSTKDQNNDKYEYNCALLYKGAWWYKDCQYSGSNLNGRYLKGEAYGEGVTWYHFKDSYDSMKFVEMKLHPH